MQLATVLRVLIVAVILLPVLGATVDTLAPGLLPPDLAAYSERELERPMGTFEYLLASTLNDVATFCDGAVLALIWFSDLRGRFERPV